MNPPVEMTANELEIQVEAEEISLLTGKRSDATAAQTSTCRATQRLTRNVSVARRERRVAAEEVEGYQEAVQRRLRIGTLHADEAEDVPGTGVSDTLPIAALVRPETSVDTGDHVLSTGT